MTSFKSWKSCERRVDFSFTSRRSKAIVPVKCEQSSVKPHLCETQAQCCQFREQTLYFSILSLVVSCVLDLPLAHQIKIHSRMKRTVLLVCTHATQESGWRGGGSLPGVLVFVLCGMIVVCLVTICKYKKEKNAPFWVEILPNRNVNILWELFSPKLSCFVKF